MQIGEETKKVVVPVRHPQKAPEAIPLEADNPFQPAEKPVGLPAENPFKPVRVPAEVSNG